MRYLDKLRSQSEPSPFKAEVHSHSVTRREQYDLGSQTHLDMTYAGIDSDEIVEAHLHEAGRPSTLLTEDDLELLKSAGVVRNAAHFF